MTDHGHGGTSGARLARRIERMLAAGRITPEEAARVRAAAEAGEDLDALVSEIRRRHAREWVAAAVEHGRLSEDEADEVVAAVERGGEPRGLGRLRHRRKGA